MTKRATTIALFVGILAIAIGYASAFTKGGAPWWGAWLLAIGIPITLNAVMILGAIRRSRGIGRLAIPFAFVALILVAGFGAALAMPSTEATGSTLWLGLPARAAIVIYGIGLLPIFVLPIAYAVTFETQTLSADDIERVRAAGKQRLMRNESVKAETGQTSGD